MDGEKASIPRRDPQAPRLIAWEGERCVPWAPDPQVVYEHLNRYLWAAGLVSGRSVLDLASGEGFGAAILATSATSVLGVDIDPASVEHARTGYRADNLGFAVADALDLQEVADGAHEAVVAFEMIEHVEDHARLLSEMRRVLAPQGLLVVSTPDRDEYAQHVDNPFHVHELNRAEFEALIGEHFAHVAVFSQRTVAGAALARLPADGAAGGSQSAAWLVERVAQDGTWQLTPGLPAMYLIAVASDAPLPPMPDLATLVDGRAELIRAASRDAAQQAEAEIAGRERELVRVRGRFLDTDHALSRARRENARLRLRADEAEHRAQEMATHFHNLRMSHNQLEANVAALLAGNQAAETEWRRRNAELYDDWEGRYAELEARAAHQAVVLTGIYGSTAWQILQRTRGLLLAALGGPSGRPVAAARSTRRALRRVGAPRTAPAGPAPAAVSAPTDTVPVVVPAVPTALPPRPAEDPKAPPIRFPQVAQPAVSIVMPVHAHAGLTADALRSILDFTSLPSFEVIVVDDSDDSDVKALLASLEGVTVITNTVNVGYQESIRRGTERARGEWLVLANNDIVVRRGWLDALVDCGESQDDIAIVAPKYVFGDHSLAEAGGIIWRDATGANYGRYRATTECGFEFRREIDYGSAAALLVRADVWRELGGYDPIFAPMYYEDTDLCFRARAAGYRVMYEPRAEVVHLEGSTAGTDETVGHKRHQATNRERFHERWSDVLEREHLPNDPVQHWRGANRLRHPKVLVVDHMVPMWDRDAGSLRMREILACLCELGAHVTLLPAEQRQARPYTAELQRLGVEVIYDLDPRALMQSIGPELSLALLSRPEPAAARIGLIRELAPAAFTVYDSVDLHWLREARGAAVSRGAAVTPGAAAMPGAVETEYEQELVFTPHARAVRELERAMMRATDLTLSVSEVEAARMRDDVPGVDVRVLALSNRLRTDAPGPELRSGLVFVGGFLHPPNVDAALSLVEDIMPLVWAALPSTELTIVGGDAPPEVLALAGNRVRVAGWVEDLGSVLGAARALIAPLRYGAGMKGKVSQALAEGLPVVTTEIGAEGFDATDGEEMLIGHGEHELADRAVRALTDDQLWRRLSAAGQVLVAERASPTQMTDRLAELLRVAGEHSSQ